MYSTFVNYKFERKTAPLIPLADNTRLSCTASSLRLFAMGETDRLEEIANGLAHRVESDKFNQRLMTGLDYVEEDDVSERSESVGRQSKRLRWSSILGESHPAVGALSYQPTLLARIHEGDLKKLHKRVTRTGNLRLFGVGGLDSLEFAGLMEKAFGELREPDDRQEPQPAPNLLSGPVGFLLETPGMADAKVEVTLPPFPKGMGWVRASLVQESLRLRLNDRLRQQEGLCYTISTRAVPVGSSAVLEVALTTFPNATEDAFRALREELRDLSDSGVPEVLLARAKVSLVGGVWRQLFDAERAYSLLSQMAPWGSLSPDPIAEILEVELELANKDLRLMVSPDTLAFAVMEPDPGDKGIDSYLVDR